MLEGDRFLFIRLVWYK